MTTESKTVEATSTGCDHILDMIREVRIDFQERTIGAFRMFSVVITLHQEKRREREAQLPRINNDIIHAGGPLSSSSVVRGRTTVTQFFFRVQQKLHQQQIQQTNSEAMTTQSTTSGHYADDTPMEAGTTTERQVIMANVIGSLHEWITVQIKKYRLRTKQQQQQKQHRRQVLRLSRNTTRRPQPILQEIIFDYSNSDSRQFQNGDIREYSDVVSSRDSLFGDNPTQISHFTPTGMMVEHSFRQQQNPSLENQKRSLNDTTTAASVNDLLGFNATARRNDSFSLVYVLDDERNVWKPTHLPSMQPRRLSSARTTQIDRPSTPTSTGLALLGTLRSSRTSFQATRRLSQILLATFA